AGATGADSDTPERVAPLQRGDVCCLIYTSGTGGVPKGVMHTHGSILCNLRGCYEVLLSFRLGDKVFLSFLPLSHSYEHTAKQFLPVSLSAQIYYTKSVDRLLDNMAEVRRTLMLAVPRLYEVMHQRVLRAMDKTTGLRRRLFDLALSLNRLRYERAGRLSLLQYLDDHLVDRLVRRKVQQRLGRVAEALGFRGGPRTIRK